MTFGGRVRTKREELGMTQEELAGKLGYKSRASINKIEQNKRNMKQSQIATLAQALETTPGYLMGWEESTPAVHERRHFSVPVYDHVAAGIPIDAIEDVVDQEDLNADTFREPEKEYFGVRIKGHSMEPRICDGDTVIVHRQSDAESGQIVIVNVDGDYATCKRLKKYEQSIALLSLNPSYEPMIFSADQVEQLPVRIRGVVVELRAKF